jgi:hypothetical protein
MLFIIFVIIFATIIAYQYPTLKRLYTGLTFFSESYIVENFRSMTKLGQPYNGNGEYLFYDHIRS